MTVVDLTGKAITELLTFPAVTAIVGAKVRPQWAQDEGPPGIIVAGLGTDFSPMGRTRGARLQAPTFAARCYGATPIQASQLGNAVVEAMELRRGRRDGSGRTVFLSLVDSAGNPDLDPLTNWPFTTVVFTLIGAMEATA